MRLGYDKFRFYSEVLTDFAPGTSPSHGTQAGESADSVLAGRSSKARLRRTLVHVDPAVRSGEPTRTQTPEPAGTTLAGAPVVARLTLALVNWFVTERTTPAQCAAALRNAGNGRHDTGSPVQTLSRLALDGPLGTGPPRPPGSTLASVIRVPINANPTVFARVRNALVDIWKKKNNKILRLEPPSNATWLVELTVLTERPGEARLADAARAHRAARFALPTATARGHHGYRFVRHRHCAAAIFVC